ncbi:MAG: flagellar basal body-associated FliL family protein [Pseudomonadota bacterium]|jgi:flagellar FliL protein
MAKKEKPAKEAEAEAPEDGAPEGEEGGKKKPPLKLIIIGAVAAVLVLGGGGGAAFMFLAPKGDAKNAKHEKPKGEKPKAEKGKGEKSPISYGPDGVVFYTLPDVVANIQTADGRPTFLKLKIALELPDESASEAIENNAPRLNDMFQTFLRELRPEDLSGSEGSYELRMEIQRRINLVIAPAKVNAVLIEEMLIN